MTPAEKERAAVVAWLRRVAGKIMSMRDPHPLGRAVEDSSARLIHAYADAIERGDHLTGRP